MYLYSRNIMPQIRFSAFSDPPVWSFLFHIVIFCVDVVRFFAPFFSSFTSDIQLRFWLSWASFRFCGIEAVLVYLVFIQHFGQHSSLTTTIKPDPIVHHIWSGFTTLARVKVTTWMMPSLLNAFVHEIPTYGRQTCGTLQRRNEGSRIKKKRRKTHTLTWQSWRDIWRPNHHINWRTNWEVSRNLANGIDPRKSNTKQALREQNHNLNRTIPSKLLQEGLNA